MPRSAIDYRRGGKPVWRIVPDGWEGFIRLPDEVLKSVVFLGKKVLDQKTGVVAPRLGGTAFFVGVEVGLDASFVCLVTARHVAKEIEHGHFFVRANLIDGTSHDFYLDAGQDVHWLFHPTDDSVDAAVLLWCPPPEVDFLCIPNDMFLTPVKIVLKGIGIGDEVYVTGLYRFHPGQARNEPIVRSGNIAMMPKERIPAPDWHERGIEGYLIEGRSIGGFSGSPVFVQRSVPVLSSELADSGREPLAAGAIFWLGLMHGHWNAKPEDVDRVMSDSRERHEEPINAGISIVVPSGNVVEILTHETIREAVKRGVDDLVRKHHALMDGTSPNKVKQGKRREAALRLTAAISAHSPAHPISQTTPKTDSVFGKGDANPDHKEDFMSLLGEAATTKPQADQT